MTRRPKLPLPTKNLAPSAAGANAIVQVKGWLLGVRSKPPDVLACLQSEGAGAGVMRPVIEGPLYASPTAAPMAIQPPERGREALFIR